MDVPSPRTASSTPGSPPHAPARGGGPPTPRFREALARLGLGSPPHASARAPRGGALPQDDEAPRGRRAPSPRDERSDPASGGPFVPLPSVLGPPPGAPAPPPPVGSAADRASLAALAERMVQSLALGRIGRDGHEVRLCLRGRGGEPPLEVCLRYEGARLSAVLRGAPGAALRAEELAERLRGELDRRGLDLTPIEVRVG